MSERALRLKDLHDWGYRFVWPPTIGNLTPTHLDWMELAKAAEMDRDRQLSEQAQGGGQSLSERHYDGVPDEAVSGDGPDIDRMGEF